MIYGAMMSEYSEMDREPLVRYGNDDYYRKWADQIPYLDFPDEWLVRPIPPFGGAVVRFTVKLNNTDTFVSVYLDCDNTLGIWHGPNGEPAPYWEVHPYEGDVWRCNMGDTDKLISAIRHALAEQILEKMGEQSG